MQLAMKAQEKEHKEQTWVEEDWKAWKKEWSRVAVLNKEAVEKASEKAVREMLMMFCQISSVFLWPLSQN